eukprot:TRINITY_DN3871_c0_g1_i1.p1 TRINITY_DN3871_c0_g1~~TRINITY_DN3871_c0_g1_i1.p1  ORF type:complete len:829 (+),score=305.83 TRINITY_DN3871_c0_g1_i1:127-2613(+)
MSSKAKHGHSFEDRSFKSPATCALCADKIWGFGKNKRCKICKAAFHKKCTSMVLPKCEGSADKDDDRRASVVTATGEVQEMADNTLHERVTAACADKEYESLKAFVANKRVVKPFFRKLDESGCTPLQLAVQAGDIVVVDALLNAMDGDDVNAVDAYGNTALHFACKAGQTKNDRVLEALLAIESIDVTLANNDDNTPLHYFCQKYATINCAQVGGKLLSKGGLPLVLKQNKNKETALHYAMFNQQFRLPMARFLIRATTSLQEEAENQEDIGESFVNTQNSKGETALHYGVRMSRPDVVQLLLSAGADISIKNEAGETASSLAATLREKAKNAAPGTTPMGTAGSKSLPTIVEALDNAKWLREWLTSDDLDMARYVGKFVRGGVTAREMADLSDQHLADMGIAVLGDRMRILKKIKKDKKKSKSKSERKDKEHKSKTKKDSQKSSKKKDKGKSRRRKKEEAPASLTVKQQLEQLQYIQVSPGDWIRTEHLEFLEQLGSGACGVVMKGIYTHPNDGSQHDVAIKVLKEAESDKEIDEFKKEFQILSAVKSPYMVHFYGAQLSPKLCMVMELCPHGSLWDVLQTPAKENVKVDWPQALEWGRQLAAGVDALHGNNPQIVHRDLKTLNLLVSAHWSLKVCDFGLSRFSTSSNLETLAKMRGTMAYCPPEAYFGEQFTSLSDIYSIGVILWELFNRTIKGEYNRPFYEYPNLTMDFQIIIQVARRNKRPTITETWPAALKELVESCWRKERDERPSAAKVMEQLSELQAAFEAANGQGEWEAAYVGAAKEARAKDGADDDDDEEEASSSSSDDGDDDDDSTDASSSRSRRK